MNGKGACTQLGLLSWKTEKARTADSCCPLTKMLHDNQGTKEM